MTADFLVIGSGIAGLSFALRAARHGSVIVVSACSGHGFKFASALGEAVADLAMDHAPRFDLAPFRIGRFGAGEAGAPVR